MAIEDAAVLARQRSTPWRRGNPIVDLASCKKIGKRVGVLINYDSFRISEDTYDDYAEMDR